MCMCVRKEIYVYARVCVFCFFRFFIYDGQHDASDAANRNQNATAAVGTVQHKVNFRFFLSRLRKNARSFVPLVD